MPPKRPRTNAIPKPESPLFGIPLLTIALTAFAVFVPTFSLGIPSGHDFEFHMNSWMEVLSQWRLGIVYPHWAGLAHFGYGEARFIFYPPASWMLGAALGSFLPWPIVPFVYQWVALTLSGCSMFLLARHYLPRRDAIFAAALYAANPYYIVIVYWRSALAELLAGALLPLLLLFVLRSKDSARKAVLPLALIVAAAWLTNIPSAVMLTYSLALLLLVAATIRRSFRPLALGAAALLIGLALASFYIIPVLYEQKWVEIAQVLSPGVRPQDNFIFTSLHDPDHDHFNLLISLLSIAELVLLAIFCWISRSWRDRARELWWMLTSWSAACAFLLCSLSLLFYRFLPELRYVQLPLRWLLCLNVGFAMLATMATKRWWQRVLACLCMLAVLIFVWHRVQQPWWDTQGDIAEMLDNQQTGVGYDGIDEYVPTGADVYEIRNDARRVAFDGPGSARIRIFRWDPESKTFSATVTHPGKLVLKLFSYPAWRVEVNGHPVPTEMRRVTAQVVIPVEAGENQIQIHFARTRDRTIGGYISLLSVILILGVILFERRAATISRT